MRPLPATHPLAIPLRTLGLTLSEWAKVHGYNPRTVQVTAKRWAHRTDRKPHGGLTRQIMSELNDLLCRHQVGEWRHECRHPIIAVATDKNQEVSKD